MKNKTFSIFVLCVMTSCLKDKLEIINQPNYCFGLVNAYSSAGRGLDAQIQFRYAVKQQGYFNQYLDREHGWSVPEHVSIHHGDHFMVQYDSLSPQTARMLFGYPLPDSTTFVRYVTQFKLSPPGYP